MKMIVSDGDSLGAWVDRSGSARKPGGPEGFCIQMKAGKIEFDNENDAEHLALLVLERLGYNLLNISEHKEKK